MTPSLISRKAYGGAVTEPQDEDRVSLAPLEPEDALRALLAVDPEDEPVVVQTEPTPESEA